MKVLLAVCGVLLAFSILCVSSTSLEVQLNGLLTNDTQFCSGETLTFVCTVQASIFIWTVGSILSGGENDGRAPVGTGGSLSTMTVGSSVMFTLTAEGSSAPNFRSTLTVNTSAELNGVVITCANDLNRNNNQTAVVEVYDLDDGPISVDNMIIGPLENSQLNLNVSYSVPLDVCLNSINATLSCTNGSAISTRSVGRSTAFDGLTYTLTFDGLNLCDYNYNYSVMGFGIVNTRAFTEVIAVSGTGNVTILDIVGGDDNVTIFLTINFTDCPNSKIQVNRSDGQSVDIQAGFNRTVVFNDAGGELDNCTIYVLFDSGWIFNISSFECDITSTLPPPSVMPTNTSGALSTGAIAGIAVGGIVAVIVVLLILIVGLVMCCRPNKSTESKSGNNVEMTQQLDYKPEDNMPTYQAPEAIKREAASNTGELYTVPEAKKKKTKASKPPENAPTYSVVNKGEKKDDNLVYADIDVKNPTAARSKRPPPPPGVTEHDANEPVLYSTLQ